MPWLSVKLDVSSALAEPLCDWLSDNGALSVSVADAGDDPILEPDPDAHPLWPTVRVDALFARDADQSTLSAALRDWLAGQGAADAGVSLDEVADQDWSQTWRRGMTAQHYRGRLCVAPRDYVARGDEGTVLRLNPGLAFGTGTHPTTALCLDWLAATDLRDRDVLDYGCGSGILGIAALLLGARSVTAVDHDAQALVATRDNASVNGIDESRLSLYTPENLPERRAAYDVIVANILANPLIALAPQLAASARPGARLVLSGILEDQWPSVHSAYAGVRFAAPVVHDGWLCAAGVVHASESPR
jgi:ribosomal protein L11 methyltransferase